MTRKEAITVLNMIEAHGSLAIQAKDRAIKALEQEPCEDCISRQAVLAIAGDSCLDLDSYEDTKDFCDEINELPPVTPKPKTGHWRHYEGMLICSECGTEFYDDIMEYCGDDVPKCCPNCGAKMIEPQERSDKE